ncbi:MAG TPA: DUF6600 domain-containing protein [Terracidiphilus sp.]|nr:DUF6600 domain-containing protein [Terracidiphilus sp.]
MLLLAAATCLAQPDPPAQAGRLSYITGQVSVQPAGIDNWGQAYPNLPLGPGDRIVTDFDGRAEIQVGQTFVRIGPKTDVTLVDSTPLGIYFGVAQGSVHIRTNGLWQGQAVYANTPSGSAMLVNGGQFRVDVMPDQPAALFTSFGNLNLFITGAGGFSQYVGGGQALELIGSNPVVPQWMQPADWDDLDNFSHQRDEQILQAMSYRYVSPEVPGAYELDANGDWMPGTPYGPIWFPRNVPYGWAPYHYGHWVNHAPWGWVWVEDESWGYAPFHYGRWVSWNGRWGWVPGPPAAHPVWSPALVVFAGGIHVGGVGVSAWFPLGPGEPYRPWYPCSPRYTDQVNITNIVEAPRVHVQTTYVNVNVVNITYVNRTTAVTAMRQEDFASGRPAHQANVVVDVHQFDHVQPLAAPEPRPTPQSFIGHPPVRAVQVSAVRPVLINEKGKAVSATPGAKAVEPPVKPAPLVRALPGHTIVAPPPGAGKPQPGAPTPPGSFVRPAPPAPPAPVTPAPKPAPAAVTPSKPALEPAPKTAPPAVNRPAAPVAPVEPTAPPKPAVKPTPGPGTTTPPPPAGKTPTEPNAKPAAPSVTKPTGPPAAPPQTVKPGTAPPAKTDKDKKDDKNKPKDDKTPQ